MNIYSILLQGDEEIREICKDKEKLSQLVKNSSLAEQFKALKFLVISHEDIYLELRYQIIPIIMREGGLLTDDSIDILLKDKWPFILSAVMKEDVELMRILLNCIEDSKLDKDYKIALLNTPSHIGVIPLHLSVRMKTIDITKLLLEAGANPNGIFDQDIRPPLRIAILFGSPDQVRLLLDFKADLNF